MTVGCGFWNRLVAVFSTVIVGDGAILVEVGFSVVGEIIKGMMTNVLKPKQRLLLYWTAHFQLE